MSNRVADGFPARESSEDSRHRRDLLALTRIAFACGDRDVNDIWRGTAIVAAFENVGKGIVLARWKVLDEGSKWWLTMYHGRCSLCVW
jgi:hypothetical protein